MDALTSIISSSGGDRDLEHLLDAFGSLVSLKDIASAYCQSGQDVGAAAELLCNLYGSSNSGASSGSSRDKLEGLGVSSEWSDDNQLEKCGLSQTNSITSKQKKNVVSMGTISAVIGREYARSRPLINEPNEVTKPLKLNSEEFPEIQGEKAQRNTTATVERMHNDIEEFLFKMLGDGFQLDKKIIQEVLGLCGYDIERSMEELLGLSASNVEQNDDIFGITSQKSVEIISEAEPLSCQEKQQVLNSARSGSSKCIPRKGSLRNNKNRHHEKEILEALFSVPQRSEEAPKITHREREFRRPNRFGRVVTEPLRETTLEWNTPIMKLQAMDDENEYSEDGYQALRKAVKEYLITMKEYYKAAVDAFAKGDDDRAEKLLEEGHFFKKKAQVADEESTEKLTQIRKESVFLDLHEHDPRGAISLLKLQLTSLSGIPTIPYLKVMVGTNGKDTKEAARKRLVVKFLRRESIKWDEEDNGQTIVIQLDKIDPKSLTFAKKS
ncbi:hypothetical protein NMG60_11037090 [Bertholletia excelsa]